MICLGSERFERAKVASGDLNLIKLCVGVENPEELIAWQAKRRAETGIAHSVHITRMWPRRASEILEGGSIYWVMKGFIKARQSIIGLEKVTGEESWMMAKSLLSVLEL